jgi:hypothetical protein
MSWRKETYVCTHWCQQVSARSTRLRRLDKIVLSMLPSNQERTPRLLPNIHFVQACTDLKLWMSSVVHGSAELFVWVKLPSSCLNSVNFRDSSSALPRLLSLKCFLTHDFYHSFIHSSITLHPILHSFIHSSVTLQPFFGRGRFFSFVILYTVSRTPWTGDQPVANPLCMHRIAQT